MKKINKTGGFTLIELLVVIAIIGILSSVVLVSLNSARGKGKDTRVMSDINQIRTQLESDFTSNYDSSFDGTTGNISATNNYLIAENDLSSQGSAGIATVSTGAALNTFLTSGVADGLVVLVDNKLPSSSHVNAYALYGRLSTGSYFCVSSDGKTNPSVLPTVTASVSCPTP